MGLDMYLTRKIYIGNNIDVILEIKKEVNKIPIDIKNVKYIEEEVGYWRKANQIHKWFVDNIQNGNDDCDTYDVDINKLKDLLSICKEVKEKAILKEGYIKLGEKLQDGNWMPIMEKGLIIENSDEISKILPTESGFFFGSTEYNEYYLQDINDTIEIIEKQIKRENELEKEGLYTFLQYRSSW